MRSERAFPTCLLVVLLFLAPLASANSDIDWSKYAEEKTVSIETTDEDDGSRKRKIWLILLDGQAYIRTNSTGWGANVERNPDVLLSVASDILPLKVHFMLDPTLRGRVIQAFRKKYGLLDLMLSPLRGRNPKIMLLLPRDEKS